MSNPRLATNSDEIPTINTLVIKIRLTTIGLSIKRLKKPKKVTKSKGYYILKEGKERNTFKIIFYNLLLRNIIKGKHSTKRGTALLAY
jgi:hypothetical protein